MIHCFYHNDLDGHCAGAIVKLKFPEAEMHELSYGYDFDKDVDAHIDADGPNEIYLVDFRFKPEEIKDLVENCNATIHWCDHHESGFTEAAKACNEDPKLASIYEKHVKGLQNTAEAGCELVWKYLHEGKPMPLIVHHVGRWDVWDHSDPHTIPYHRGLELSGRTDPADEDAMKLWAAYIENSREGKRRDFNELDAILNMGLTGEAMKGIYDKYIGEAAYYIPNWEGYRTVALNSKVFDSYVVFEHDERWAEHEPEVLVWFYQTGEGKWKHSVRNYPGTNTSVIQIAEKYNGGGHRSAAGFTTAEQVVYPCLDTEVK